MTHSKNNLTGGAPEIGCYNATIPMFTLLCLCRNFWQIMTRHVPLHTRYSKDQAPFDFSLMTERQIGIARKKISRDQHNSKTNKGSICRFLNRRYQQKLPTTVQ
jgi:hypothetical protein